MLHHKSQELTTVLLTAENPGYPFDPPAEAVTGRTDATPRLGCWLLDPSPAPRSMNAASVGESAGPNRLVMGCGAVVGLGAGVGALGAMGAMGAMPRSTPRTSPPRVSVTTRLVIAGAPEGEKLPRGNFQDLIL